MSIASAITNAQQKVANAYTAVNNKGGTLPATQDLSNLPTAINTISTAGTVETLNVTPSTSAQQFIPSGGVDGYNPVNVSAVTSAIDQNIQPENIKKDVVILGTTGTLEAGGGIGIPREVSAQGVYQIPASSATFSLPSNATNIGDYGLYYAFYQSLGLTSVDLSSLTAISGYYAMYNAFRDCKNLTGNLDLSSLTTVSSAYSMYYAFKGCTGITSVDLSSLTTISGSSPMYYTFQGCTGITGTIDLSSLTTLNIPSALDNTFNECSGITSVDLSGLTTISGSQALHFTFSWCTGITSALLTNLETIGINSSGANYGHLSNCFSTARMDLTFPKLEKIYCTGGTGSNNGSFSGNFYIQKMYFPKLDTITYGTGASTANQVACKNIFSGCNNLIELHFAAANQAAIEASPGYSTAWGRGAGNVTIYFDL